MFLHDWFSLFQPGWKCIKNFSVILVIYSQLVINLFFLQIFRFCNFFFFLKFFQHWTFWFPNCILRRISSCLCCSLFLIICIDCFLQILCRFTAVRLHKLFPFRFCHLLYFHYFCIRSFSIFHTLLLFRNLLLVTADQCFCLFLRICGFLRFWQNFLIYFFCLFFAVFSLKQCRLCLFFCLKFSGAFYVFQCGFTSRQFFSSSFFFLHALIISILQLFFLFLHILKCFTDFYQKACTPL